MAGVRFRFGGTTGRLCLPVTTGAGRAGGVRTTSAPSARAAGRRVLQMLSRGLFFKNCAADKRGHKIYWTVDDWRSDRSTSRLVLQIRLFSSAFGCPMRAG